MKPEWMSKYSEEFYNLYCITSVFNFAECNISTREMGCLKVCGERGAEAGAEGGGGGGGGGEGVGLCRVLTSISASACTCRYVLWQDTVTEQPGEVSA